MKGYAVHLLFHLLAIVCGAAVGIAGALWWFRGSAPALWAGVAALVLGPREVFRRPALWAGAGIALLAMLPYVLWQARHGWPQLEMREVVAAENWWGPAYVPVALLCAGIAGAGLLCLGTWALLRSPELRFLGWTFLGVTAAFVVGNGRPYYVAGFFGLLFAAGAVQLQRRREAGA